MTQTKVIVPASQKGGPGKTTLSGHIAVAAQQARRGKVAVFDLDPQGSLTRWWNKRSQLVARDIVFVEFRNGDSLVERLATLSIAGIGLAIIDTPGRGSSPHLHAALALADLVVLPTRPSPHDLHAVAATLKSVHEAKRPFTFVLNAAKPNSGLVPQTMGLLSQHGPVAPVVIYDRTEYAAAMVDGRTAQEAKPKGKGAAEMKDLWTYLDSLIFAPGDIPISAEASRV